VVVLGTASLVGCGDDDSAAPAGTGTTSTKGIRTPNVFRLSTRHNRRPCKACLSHANNRFYLTAADADSNRAHPGCSCVVQARTIDTSTVARYFANGRKVFDLRGG